MFQVHRISKYGDDRETICPNRESLKTLEKKIGMGAVLEAIKIDKTVSNLIF